MKIEISCLLLFSSNRYGNGYPKKKRIKGHKTKIYETHQQNILLGVIISECALDLIGDFFFFFHFARRFWNQT